MDRTHVTKKINYTTPALQTIEMGTSHGPSHLFSADRKRTQRLLEQVVKDNNDALVRKLTGAIHRASTQDNFLQLENEGLLASLDTENKHTKHGRRLPFGGKGKKGTHRCCILLSPKAQSGQGYTGHLVISSHGDTSVSVTWLL
jgi:hypothetical protein